MVHRSHSVEIFAVIWEFTTPLFRQDIVFLVKSLVVRMVEERLTSAAVFRVDERAGPCVAAFLSAENVDSNIRSGNSYFGNNWELILQYTNIVVSGLTLPVVQVLLVWYCYKKHGDNKSSCKLCCMLCDVRTLKISNCQNKTSSSNNVQTMFKWRTLFHYTCDYC